MPVCAGCQRPIWGRYVQAQGTTWHPEHFVCAVCQQPIHAAFVTNAWGDTYCAQHAATYSLCYSCQRLICPALTNGGVFYGDGRTMCNRCRQTAVDQVAQGLPILTHVRQQLATLGLDLGQAPIALRLTDQHELSGHAPTGADSAGQTHVQTWLQNGHVVRQTVEEMRILRGLPAEHFAAIAAHELGHVWLVLHGSPDLPPLIAEGLCELCAALWLDQQATEEATFRLRLMAANPDPVYGAGYRLARQALAGRTLPEILAYLRQHRRFPPISTPFPGRRFPA